MPANRIPKSRLDENDRNAPRRQNADKSDARNEKAADRNGPSDYSNQTFEQHAKTLRGGFDHTGGAVQRAAFVQNLQRAYGNAYVQRLADHISRTQADEIQTKLQVGAAGDRYEREADSVAQEVVSRLASHDEGAELEEEELQMKRVQRAGLEEEELMQGMPVQRAGLEEEELMQGMRLMRAVEVSSQPGAAAATIQRWKDSAHFRERMQERGISDDEVDDALSDGTMYRDEDTGGTIYYDNGLAVVTQGNTLVTCYIGQVKGRWTPL